MNVLFFTKPKKHTLECIKFLVEVGAEICGVVIYNKDSYLETDFVKYCASKNLAIYDGEDVYNHIDDFRDNLDVVFCNTYPKLIKNEILDMAKEGGFNFHMAPLPEYKGVFGFNFAIYNEERKYGVTCHKLSEQFDEGELIKVVYFEIDAKNITVMELVKESEKQTLELFKQIYYALEAGESLKGIPQEGGCYYSRRKFEELKRISEGDSEAEIERKIRAFWYPPYEGAYTVINGKKYTVVDEKILSRMNQDEQ